MIKYKTDSFLKTCHELFHDMFDYSKTEYVNKTTKVKIICKKHDFEFSQIPDSHIRGFSGCKLCSLEKLKNTNLEKYGHEFAIQNKETKDKSKKTNLEKYGHEFPTQNSEVREKTKSTNLEKYGCEYVSQLPEFKDKMLNTIKITNLEKYGTECCFGNKSVRKSRADTMIKRYNTTFPLSNPDIKQKLFDTNMKKYGVKCVLSIPTLYNKTLETRKFKTKQDYISKLPSNFILTKFDYKSTVCLFDTITQQTLELPFQAFYLRIKNNINLYESSPSTSVSENEVYDFIKQYVECEQSNRSILNGKELDIFISSRNMAIEFNGLYWHSELHKSNNYHLNKTEECEKLGIQLIHIFEDDWLYKQDIVKSRLKSLLGISDRRIFARKCEIKELDSKTSKQFLEENHIQGNVNSKYRYGLFDKDNLVAVMTFGNSRFEKDELELHRFANKLNCNVIGGASKLFKHFLKQNISSSIISYANRSWSLGKLYETLCFKLIGKTKPNYSYVINGSRLDRFKYRKSELVKQGFDPSMTEVEIMNERKYYRIFDSGSLKYKYVI